MHRPHRPRRRIRITTAAGALLAAIALAGCGTSGYGTVNEHQVVLIPTALPTAPATRRAEAALVCGARIEAHHLHHALRLARPHHAGASSQIAVADAVTNNKPGGIVIVPAAHNAMLAPILSMRRAGIRVVELASPRDPAAAAAEGARAVARLVHAPAAVSLLAPCASAQ